MEAILIWGFWEKSALDSILGNVADRFHAEKAGGGYRELVFGEWWTDTELR